MKVADMHCDTISEIYGAQRNGVKANLLKNHLHIDLEKLTKGDYLLQNFAMYVNMKKHDNPLEYCLELIDLYYQELALNEDKIGIALSYEDIMKNQKAGKISALLTIEEGGVLKGSLTNLRNFYRLGVRMLTLTWNYKNGIGFPNFKFIEGEIPNPYTPDTINGLTDFGIELIGEMEQLGMIIDVSHLSDAGFYHVLEHTTKPFVASHSNARSVCNHVRNLTDDMIRKLANRGGVIGINYCPAFLQEVLGDVVAEGTIAAIVENIKYIISIGGYECIGLGSDFDGIVYHKELPDASYLPMLEAALKKAGLKQHEIEAIFNKNVLRLYRDVLR